MTPRQKRIIAAIAIVDIVVILVMAVFATRFFGETLSLPAPTHVPGALPQGVCQWKATQLLAQAGLGGTVTLAPGESLRFEIAYPLAPDQTADAAAQQVWTVFDVALALEEEQCGIFSQVEVAILAAQPNARDKAHNNQSNVVRISASASTANLVAFGAGELGEDEFIERVFYTANSINEQ